MRTEEVRLPLSRASEMHPEPTSGRVRRERQTLESMLVLYCRERHGGAEGLCGECAALLDYARERIARCPWGDDKPTCARCAVHCYRMEEREAIREAMRFAGPRMLRHHPVLALLHLLDGRRPSDLEGLRAARAQRHQERVPRAAGG